MQEPEHLIRILHIPDPRIPRAVFDAVAETREHEDHGEHGVGRVYANYTVGDDLADGADGPYAQLAEAHVYFVIEEGGQSVAHEGGEEDEGDDGVVYAVVDFELRSG